MLDLCLMCPESNDSLPIKLETLTLSLTNGAVQSPFFPNLLYTEMNVVFLSAIVEAYN